MEQQAEKKEVTMDQYHILLNKDLKGIGSNIDTLFDIVAKQDAEIKRLSEDNKRLNEGVDANKKG